MCGKEFPSNYQTDTFSLGKQTYIVLWKTYELPDRQKDVKAKKLITNSLVPEPGNGRL